MAQAIIPLVIAIGGAVIQYIFKPKPKDQVGPRLSDINVPSVSPGNPIIRAWGQMKVPGQIIWTSRLIETKHVEDVAGGKGGDSPTSTTFTYSVHAAWGICEGPIASVDRVWANQKLLWRSAEVAATEEQDFINAYYAELDRLTNQAGLTDYNEAYCAAFFFAMNNYLPEEYTNGTQADALAFIMAHPGVEPYVVPSIPAPNSTAVNAILAQMLDGLQEDATYQKLKKRFKAIEIYLGTEEQLPSPKLEEEVGVGNMPAFRGVAYFVLDNLQLEDFGNTIPQMNIQITTTTGDVFLHQIINDICAEAELATDEYEAGFMKDVVVPGFAITKAMSARDAISSLQQVFPFDAAESGYQIRFRWINVRPVAILDVSDFGAHINGDDMPPTIETSRIPDTEMPKRINLTFQEPVRNYSTNTVFATRQTGDMISVTDVDSTIALTRVQAKSMVEEQLSFRYTLRRGYKVVLPPKYVMLDPCDAIMVRDPYYPDDPTQYVSWRLVEMTVGVNGLIEGTFTDHFFHIENLADAGDELDTDAASEIPLSSRTRAYLMDLPLLTDTEDDNIGYYAALQGTEAQWPGGALYLDMSSGSTVTAFGVTSDPTTSGTTWTLIASNENQVPHGYAMGVLGSAAAGVWDYASRVRIYNVSPMFPSSASEADILINGLNLALLGDELIAYANATDLGNRVWELDTFLRGLRGTEWAIGAHAVGDRFVRLSSSSVARVTHTEMYLNQSGDYRAITSGDLVSDATSFAFTNTGVSKKPRAVQVRTCTIDGSDNRVLNWLPRARQNGNLISGSTVSLDQAVEQYEIEVWQGTLKATETVTSARTLSYSAATATSDGCTASNPILFKIYQIGAVVGRGYVSEVTI